VSLDPYLCTNCGFWQRHFAVPTGCRICEDHRHVLPDDGWEFLTPAEADARVTCRWDEVEPGVWRYLTEPGIGIAPSGYLIETPQGSVAFEGAGWMSDAALDHMASRGPLAWLSASHPHSYGALWRVEERFGPRVALQRDDLDWALTVTASWPYDDRLSLGPGLTLHHTGGHFAGHAVLHDAGRGILFCGDALKFRLAADGRTATGVSCHKAFVRRVPLTPAEMRRYREVFAALDFHQTWTPFEQAANAGRAEALRLLDAQLAGLPTTDWMPL
jgi:hypothetical protein